MEQERSPGRPLPNVKAFSQSRKASILLLSAEDLNIGQAVQADNHLATRTAWNEKAKQPTKRTNYWQFPEICSHINQKICGKPLPGVAHGFHHRLGQLAPFEHAVSVGCGRGTKEKSLLTSNIVEQIDCYDLADKRLIEAERIMAESGVLHRARLFCEDAFAQQPLEMYDLVYWHSSLHHMPDTRAAIEWSWKALRPGGIIALREYTGPSRWQWTDRNIEYLNRFRAALPENLKPDPLLIERPTVKAMEKRDPSEACDSGHILPALHEFFPEAEVIPLGGAIYSFGLRGIAPKLTKYDGWFFEMLMAFDDALIDESLVTFAIARKSS